MQANPQARYHDGRNTCWKDSKMGNLNEKWLVIENTHSDADCGITSNDTNQGKSLYHIFQRWETTSTSRLILLIKLIKLHALRYDILKIINSK